MKKGDDIESLLSVSIDDEEYKKKTDDLLQIADCSVKIAKVDGAKSLGSNKSSLRIDVPRLDRIWPGYKIY